MQKIRVQIKEERLLRKDFFIFSVLRSGQSLSPKWYARDNFDPGKIMQLKGFFGLRG